MTNDENVNLFENKEKSKDPDFCEDCEHCGGEECELHGAEIYPDSEACDCFEPK